MGNCYTSVMNRLFTICGVGEGDGRKVTYPKGSLVDDRDGTSRSVVLVLSGTLLVYSAVSDEKRLLLSKLESGDIFGIANLFLDEDLSTVLECGRESVLFLYPKEKLREKILSSGEAAECYSTLLNTKLQFLTKRISLLSMPSSRSRLAAALIDGVEYRSLEELSSLLNISRATLFRELASLEKGGVIERRGRRIVIKEREKLLNFV